MVLGVGEEEIARFIHDLERQEDEERGHRAQTMETARALFPQRFDGEHCRYQEAPDGATCYLAVLRANRDPLQVLGSLEKSGYEHTARHAVEQVGVMMTAYADPASRRAEIEAAAKPQE